MKITPSGLIDTLVQSSGGTTIQNSYGGLQLHRKAYQRKKKSLGQQNVRSAFTHVQSTWGSLTTEQQATWNAAADPGTSGFQLYSSTNNVLVNASQTIIPDYTNPITPVVVTIDGQGTIYEVGANGPQLVAILTSSDSSIPTSGWVAYVKWSGWIAPSQTRFPALSLTMSQENIGYTSNEEIILNWFNGGGNAPGPRDEFWKNMTQLNWLNTTTGQIVEGTPMTIVATSS